MSTRQVLGGATAVLVAVSALYYLVLAPSRGSSQDPGSVQVAISATAGGSGSWVRYLITVKDVADGDFSGEVLLIDLDQSAQAGTSATTTPPNLGSAGRLPVAGEVAGQSAYQVHVTVPSRKARTVSVLAPEGFNYVQAVSGSTVLADAAVERPAVIPVAVLSDVETAADAISGLHFDRFTPRVAAYSAASQFPGNPTLLAGYSAIVIDRFDSAMLSGAQVDAIRQFVALGGSLVVVGGRDWRRTVSPLPADLLPVRPDSTSMLSLAPVAQLAGLDPGGGDVTAASAVGELAPGARPAISAAGGEPLLAELPYGAGRVVQLAFDPATDPASTLAGPAWTQALGRGFSQPPGGNPGASPLLGAVPGFTALLPGSGDPPLPAPIFLAALLLFYLLVAGPLGYLVVRRQLGRPALFWVSVPLTAVVFTAAFYGLGQLVQGSTQDHEVQVIKVGPGHAASSVEYHRILFLHRGNHEIEPQRNALVAPLTLDTYRTTGSTCERCTTQLEGLPAGAEHVLPGSEPVVEENGVVFGSVRVVASASAVRAPAGVDARLSVRNGRVQGTVANLGTQPEADLELFTFDGQSFHAAGLAGFLGPHAQAGVDAALGDAAPGGGPPVLVPGTVGSLLQAAALTSLGTDGQAVLVALTVPTPSALRVDGEVPPRLAVAVLEQPLTLQGADSSLRDFERKLLASTTGDQQRGYLDVYDIELPPTASPLVLDYTRQFASGLEVYDWARGAWAPVAAAGSGAAQTLSSPLTAGETRGGLVRVRTREPRVLWGANLWVDTPSAAG